MQECSGLTLSSAVWQNRCWDVRHQGDKHTPSLPANSLCFFLINLNGKQTDIYVFMITRNCELTLAWTLLRVSVFFEIRRIHLWIDCVTTHLFTAGTSGASFYASCPPTPHLFLLWFDHCFCESEEEQEEALRVWRRPRCTENMSCTPPWQIMGSRGRDVKNKDDV